MSTKNTLLALGAVVVIVGGYLMVNKQEAAEPADSGYSQQEEPAVPAVAKPVSKTTTQAVAKTSSAPVAAPIAATVRLLENGQYVTIINLTNGGFVPQAVSIARGESVRFVNQSSSAMRILSSVEHMGLNQEKTVGQGGTYELSFQKAGTWTFRNGKNTSVIGVVNVK